MKCICDKETKTFHCLGEGYVHEIRIFEDVRFIESYVCGEDDTIDTVIVEGKVIVIRSRQEESKEFILMEVYI
jgi:hypothetical protein